MLVITINFINTLEVSGDPILRTSLGAYLHFDSPEYNVVTLFSGATDSVINIEVQLYTEMNSSYYVFSRYVRFIDSKLT